MKIDDIQMIDQVGEKAFILFSGYNQRAVIAFCRFARKYEIPFYIVANGENDAIYKTEYSDRIIKEREGSSLDFKNLVRFLSQFRDKQGFRELVILPSTEYLNRFLLEHKSAFKKKNITVPLVDKPLYKNISDKYPFYNICKKNGFAVPEEIDREHPTFPMVIKPKRYFKGEGKVQSKPYFANTRSEFDEFREGRDLSNYYFQEYVDGPSFYLLYYISGEGNHVSFSQKNLVQQSNGGSMLAAVSSDLHLEPISKKYIQLFEGLGFHGLVMVELKKQDGKYYMIEANPRLWGPSQLLVDARASIFGQFVSELGFACGQIENSRSNGSRYFWHGGLVEELTSDRELTYYSGYNKKRLFRELPKWMNYEIYRKNDTNSIFWDEGGNKSKIAPALV